MKKFIKKPVAIILAVVLLVGAVVGGTLAWLTDKTDSVVNTFTTGNINITLAETTGTTYQMVPGWKITKNPVATVKANSEDCYLFVKLDKSDKYGDYMTYEMAEGWSTLGDSYPGVFYREVAKTTADQPFAVIKDNKITVNESVTKEMMDAIEKGTVDNPTLTITAYAIQKDKTNNTPFGAETAWKTLNGITT